MDGWLVFSVGYLDGEPLKLEEQMIEKERKTNHL
jgi:hypothetical protein